MKKFLISCVVLFVLWMLGSWLVHGALLMSDYGELGSMFRSPEDSQQYSIWMLIAHVIMAAAFTWIYQRGVQPGDWPGQGLRYGAAIACMTVVPTYMIYYAVQPMPGMVVVKQIVFDAILILLLGLVVAFLNRRAA
ncbi:MAG: hypothetical protein AAF604_09300 [Acidobacteriota bacterium]